MVSLMMEAEKVCRCPSIEPRDICHLYRLGYITEYKENYDWGHFIKHHNIVKSLKYCPELNQKGISATMKYDGKTSKECHCKECPEQRAEKVCCDSSDDQELVTVRAISEHPKFISKNHKSVFRGGKLMKDDLGKYINPFKDLRTLGNGRRMMYDATHPDMIYGSQFSSELSDVPNLYSFSSLNQIKPEIPWDKDITWKAESEKSCWPSKLWKQWTKSAFSPPFDGYDDQCQYSVYKVPLSLKEECEEKIDECP